MREIVLYGLCGLLLLVEVWLLWIVFFSPACRYSRDD